VGGGGQEKSDNAEDALQKDFDPRLLLASQSKGPLVRRKHPARDTKRKVLYDNLSCKSICADNVQSLFTGNDSPTVS
jgi:hypothetical protein